MCQLGVLPRHYKKAAEYADALGDLESASNLYEHYPQLYPDRRGSMVPFSLFVLRAELPSYAGPEGLARSLDALFALRDTCAAKLAALGAATPSAKPLADAAGLVDADLDSFGAMAVSQPVKAPASTTHTLEEDLNQGGAPRLVWLLGEAICSTACCWCSTTDEVQTWRGREVRVLFSIATRYVQAGDYSASLRILAGLLRLYPKVRAACNRRAGPTARSDTTHARRACRTSYCSRR